MINEEVVRVDLGCRSYDIVIGSDLLARAADWIKPLLSRNRATVITDENVGALHAKTLQNALEKDGIAVDVIVVPPGEESKSFARLEALLEELLALKVERNDCLIALGGGVVGDLTGFAASILRRGVDFIQIPTTLLAQVDSSVGGKTGINSASGKNLIGSFYQPRLVLADLTLLETLPAREFAAGFAEVVKYGLIDDPRFFNWLEENAAALIAGDKAARLHAVRTSCEAKARIVAADERESGQRALLNLGHSFGHALEAEIGYGPILRHGEAVAIGLVSAFQLSAKIGLCPQEDVERIRALLVSAGLPVSPSTIDYPWDTTALMAHMAQDKKVRDGRLTYVLATGIGQAMLSSDVAPEDVETIWDSALAG